MPVAEPVTMLTDYALGALALWLGVLLFRVARWEGQLSVRLWALAFFATALSTFSGGTYHGFAGVLSAWAQTLLWKGAVYSIGLASLFMLSGTILASVRRRVGRWLVALAIVQFGIYALWMVGHDDFLYVIYDYAPAMIAVLALQVYAWLSRRDASAPWIISGVLLSFGAAGIQQSGLTLHQHFNHNDLYHVVQMVAVYLLYRGARLLTDR